MNADSSAATQFLLELFQRTQGDPAKQTSMFSVGAQVGLEKEAAGRLTEELIGQGWVEIKSLSGGIAITAEGIEQARACGASPAGAAEPALGHATVLAEQDKQSLADVLGAIKERLPQLRAAYALLEEITVDIKTIEVQMLSPRPKTAVVREVLRSVQAAAAASGAGDLAERLRIFAGG